ncbi:hypothetical protein CgunFtcFv8_015206 [Champsocephalus gunnari]|uniref:Uncharacterized protein n=1 Tax=Champsocephalus gunnari TaxID=52237 RepID=A0AAN8H039_CHAGU|nr:hypothetical protein CgunFtcFv8_015206 [Champsocephalus gunnari]
MPSEASPQEPRDRGPLPPVTRAGRSAQLAKEAATSPAVERRSRGRPRKDGPPTPPPPTPTPPKARKGRSRGRAQVDDEESMDATEKTPPQKTAPPAPSPAPASSPEKEPPIRPASPDLIPDLSPVLSPDLSPVLSPVLSLVQSPVLSPVLIPDLITVQSPVQSPGPDPGEEEEEVQPILSPAPVDQSPAPSSPPASPCPPLEDEDSLSPLFQLSDEGGSPTPSLGHTKKRLKQCAFCSLGSAPPLGLGPLVVFGPTPGYIPLHILNSRSPPDRDNDCHDHCYHGDQAPPPCSSPEQCESSSEFLDQLGPVGLPHDINVQSLFDPTGQCCAHLQCAAWSEGVCRGEGQSLLYVDKAIDSGSTQVCAFCCRLGASLRCRETSCGRSFHFPCAAAAGALQNWNQRHTLCSRHTHSASSSPCVLCSSDGDTGGVLTCCCCGNCYHGSCLDPPLDPSPLHRAGWQCPQCRVCQSCRLRGDDDVLLVCQRCDKSYHTLCLKPPLDHTPSTGWSCKNCRICRRCGVRSSGQWANHPFLCETCDPALPCPLCDLNTPQDYWTCISCYRCVHTECIVQAGEGRAGSEDYVCSTCRPQEEEPLSPTPAPPSQSHTDTFQQHFRATTTSKSHRGSTHQSHHHS